MKAVTIDKEWKGKSFGPNETLEGNKESRRKL